MALALVKTAKTHAVYAPSKAHRWLVCPGSLNLSDDPETVWAAEGTRKHAVLEQVLSGAVLAAGDTIPTEAGPYVVPLDVLEQCHEVREFIEQYKSTHEGWTVETETPVEIGSHIWPDFPAGECRGTVDAAAYSDVELLVLDAKFGFVQVEARGNPQLLLYANGLLAEIPFNIRHVTLCIAQPDYSGDVIFREHRMSRDNVEAWAFDQLHIIEELKSNSRRLQADDHACRYCPARAACPARLQAVAQFQDEEWLKAAPLEELLPLVPRLRAICKDLEARAMADLNGGKQVRGFKLVAAKSKRKWNEEETSGWAINLAAEIGIEGGIPADFMQPMKLKSPAQMEKVIRAIKKMPVKEAKAIVDKYAFQPSGMPKLAPDSDPRPALDAGGFTLEDLLKFSLEDGHADD